MVSQQVPAQPQATRPRMSLYRYFIRLCDRLELILLRYVDKDPYAQGDFEAYKKERNEAWAEDYTVKEAVLTTAIATSGPETTMATTECQRPVEGNRTPLDPITTEIEDHAMNEGKGRDVEVFSGVSFGIEPANSGDQDAKNDSTPLRGGKGVDVPVKRRHTDGVKRHNVSRPKTLLSVIESRLSEARRRKRKKSDARPGYFNPGPSLAGDGGARMKGDEEEGDKLVMNVPTNL
ncbi:uncharacterized protein CTRU02_200080 [Colletotrichum truncatum]|uniref:Uncharacterized protein n=1 Tax=Colletotrichum truncatum TaxID=5467 RepID=A0ACC3ZDH6_COLTU|nr:uncharacterized protein CTRU02_04955 [Colletotrichum truncatum]KAF6794754.1 hypothetical protein CTRU02_04955 [Colletotrichum truncatum]